MKNSSKPKISLVIPAYKAESFIAETVRLRIKELAKLGFPYELIVVIDGKSKATADVLTGIKNPNLVIFHYDTNRGKGFAVRYGMQKATGDYIGYIDAGNDILPGIITTMVQRMIKGDVDGVVPVKWLPDSSIIYPLHRKIYSRLYHFFLWSVLGIRVWDTQVGAKLYTRKMVEKVLPRLLVKRFAFEAEFLAVAMHFGYNRFAEVPVQIASDQKSTVRFIDGLHSLWDGLAVYYRLHIRRYYDRDLNFHKTSKAREHKNLTFIF
jgi:glycosyltransferase involved in cell wall biosynthesis